MLAFYFYLAWVLVLKVNLFELVARVPFQILDFLLIQNFISALFLFLFSFNLIYLYSFSHLGLFKMFAY